MTTSKNRQTRVLLSAMVLLPVGWLAVPHADQEDANDGFILLTTDRDNPSNEGISNPPQCEDIYVMAPDGSNPTRLTHGGAPIGSAGTTVAGPTGPTARS